MAAADVGLGITVLIASPRAVKHTMPTRRVTPNGKTERGTAPNAAHPSAAVHAAMSMQVSSTLSSCPSTYDDGGNGVARIRFSTPSARRTATVVPRLAYAA